MLEKPETKQYLLVFFRPDIGHVYHRATNEAQTEFEEIVTSRHRISAPFGHHCHPYFAVWNALPAFEKHAATLTGEQKYTYRLLKLVWMR